MKYDVKAQLDGRLWFIEVPAIDRATQARNIAEIEAMAADLIEIFTGEHDADLEVRLLLPEDLQAHLDAAELHRLDEAQARSSAAAELRSAAAGLRARGLTLTDVGTVLGVSHQRAHQLLNDQAPGSAEPPRRVAVASSDARRQKSAVIEPKR